MKYSRVAPLALFVLLLSASALANPSVLVREVFHFPTYAGSTSWIWGSPCAIKPTLNSDETLGDIVLFRVEGKKFEKTFSQSLPLVFWTKANNEVMRSKNGNIWVEAPLYASRAAGSDPGNFLVRLIINFTEEGNGSLKVSDFYVISGREGARVSCSDLEPNSSR